ncbi:MAG: hypothetical protein V4590_14310 [Bacteroidota bacterium]
METSSLSELKKELQTLPHPQLVELAVRMAKYKKENKELLHYLLFESHDNQSYISGVKKEVELQFKEINYTNLYYVKKSVRKVLRYVNKHIKYAAKPEVTVELLIHFLQQYKRIPIRFDNSTAMVNLFAAQLKKIDTELVKLHEDIQYDYRKELESL